MNEFQIFTSALIFRPVAPTTSATLALLGSDEGVQMACLRMMLPISNLTFAAFLLVEKTGVFRGSHRSEIKKLRKTASDMVVDLTHCTGI